MEKLDNYLNNSLKYSDALIDRFMIQQICDYYTKHKWSSKTIDEAYEEIKGETNISEARLKYCVETFVALNDEDIKKIYRLYAECYFNQHGDDSYINLFSGKTKRKVNNRTNEYMKLFKEEKEVI